MLSNAYFLAKFRFDTAENEPAKNLQNFANFPNFANPNSPMYSAPGFHHDELASIGAATFLDKDRRVPADAPAARAVEEVNRRIRRRVEAALGEAALGRVEARVERFDRRGTEPFEPFFQNKKS